MKKIRLTKVPIPKNLEIRYIDDTMGYGIFTNKPVKKDSIVEVCYCLELTEHNKTHPAYDYLFGSTYDNIYFLPFGYGSIYNHNDNPNMIWTDMQQVPRFIRFIALRDIKKDEELTHSYGNEYWDTLKKNTLKLKTPPPFKLI